MRIRSALNAMLAAAAAALILNGCGGGSSGATATGNHRSAPRIVRYD